MVLEVLLTEGNQILKSQNAYFANNIDLCNTQFSGKNQSNLDPFI